MQPVATSQLHKLRGHQRELMAAQIAERFVQATGTIRELAAELHRRPTLVRRLLQEAGVRTDDGACVGASVAEVTATLAARYRAGASIDALVAETGIDRRVIRDLLEQAQVPVRQRRSVPAERADWVIAQYRAGATLRALADAVGCSHSTIRRHLLGAGVRLRSPGGRGSQG